MANYQGTALSNTFRVTDVEAFTAAMSKIYIVVSQDPADEADQVSIYSNDPDSGGWPSSYYDEDDYAEDGDDSIDLPALIASFLKEGSVAVLEEVGNEKLRYLVGYAIAVNAAGDTREVTLSSIFELAKELGTEVNAA